MLDTSVWQTFFWAKGNPNARTHIDCEEQLYFPENVSVDNGVCTLTAEYAPNTTLVRRLSNGQLDTVVRHIKTGMIMGRSDLPAYRYGYFEASLKLPDGPGWWPAFWMWLHDEIDVLEHFGGADEFLYNVYSGPQCESTSQHEAKITDNRFHRFAVEWTPFKITFFLDGEPLPKVAYRFYDLNGRPLNISCEQPEVPEGYYYLNPNFVENRFRAFRPILNLSALPRYGLKHCTSVKPDCGAPPLMACGKDGRSDCDWGHPIGHNCEVRGQLPGKLEIDYVRIEQRTFEMCTPLMIYGNDCWETDSYTDPKACRPLCAGREAKLYFEDVTGRRWHSEPDMLEVQALSNVEILGFDGYELVYRVIEDRPAKLSMSYHGACGITATAGYEVVPSPCGLEKAFAVMPNPFQDELRIIADGTVKGPLDVSLYNSLGQQLSFYQFPGGERDYVLPIGDRLPAGAYFLVIRSADRRAVFPLIH